MSPSERRWSGPAHAITLPEALETFATDPSEALLDEKDNSPLLPNGSRLVARLEAAVTTAVKTPAVAAIEYNYERDGEIVVPAGTRAFGELQQANRTGVVSLRFNRLEMADGTIEEINGTAISLTYGPLQGSVTGNNVAKRILVGSVANRKVKSSFQWRQSGNWRNQAARPKSVWMNWRCPTTSPLGSHRICPLRISCIAS
jgi:hypothetical protein